MFNGLTDRARITVVALLALPALAVPQDPTTPGGGDNRQPGLVWHIDSLTSIGGHPVTVVGNPRVVDTELGRAVEFNGVSDALVLDLNPIAGLGRFTIEVAFAPAAGGPAEQRFLHVEEAGTENRALVELRMVSDAAWCLDTFLRSPAGGLTLIDRQSTHPASGWHIAALTWDGRTMAHYVDGVREQSGELAFGPLGPGRTSIGARLNRVSWFSGRIRLIRITPEAPPRYVPRPPPAVADVNPGPGAPAATSST